MRGSRFVAAWLEMNWRKGLLRLWAVATALWIVTVLALGYQYSDAGIEAAKLYPEYLYNHLKRHDVVAEARRVLSDQKSVEEVVGVPNWPPCVSHWERERQEAHVAELEALEAKRPPEPPPRPPASLAGGRRQS